MRLGIAVSARRPHRVSDDADIAYARLRRGGVCRPPKLDKPETRGILRAPGDMRPVMLRCKREV